MFELPLSTQLLREYLPHRPPMVWVDEVVSLSETVGECSVVLDKAKYYCDAKGIRDSSYIEWMAQAYAFSSLARHLISKGEPPPNLSRAFLVGVTDFEVPLLKPEADGRLCIQVETIRELLPVILFKGRVLESSGRLLASANLKVFAEA